MPVMVPVLTLLPPSTRNQWKLFFSLATGCWAGLGWAGLSRTLAVKFAALSAVCGARWLKQPLT